MKSCFLVSRWGQLFWCELYFRSLESIRLQLDSSRASLVAQRVKNPPATWETWVWSLGWEDPLEEGMATHSSFLAWKIPWTEKSGRLPFTGSQRVRHDWSNLALTHTHTHKGGRQSLNAIPDPRPDPVPEGKMLKRKLLTQWIKLQYERQNIFFLGNKFVEVDHYTLVV